MAARGRGFLPFYVIIIPCALLCVPAAEGFFILLSDVFRPAHDALLESGITSSTTGAELTLRWLLVCVILGVGLVAYLGVVLLALLYLYVLEAWVLRHFVGRGGLWALFSGIEQAPVIGRAVERKVRRLAGAPNHNRQ
jgi:hypothetical protein